MARRTNVANVAPVELAPKSRCTTILDNGTRCPEPRIRLNALKCTEHEIVYRAAAKIRAAARKLAATNAAAATPATATPKTRRTAKTAPVVANVAPNGLRTTRPPRPARVPIAASPATPTAS